MSPLVEAVDAVTEFLRSHPDAMSGDEVEQFHKLAEAVYRLALGRGLAGALPQVPDLRPGLESIDPPLPPPQFLTKVNLPGDWSTSDDGRVFLPCVTERWLEDMAILRRLAEQSDGPTSAAVDDWSDAKPPAVWRKELGGISQATLRRYVAAGHLVVDKISPKLWRIRADSLRRFLASK